MNDAIKIINRELRNARKSLPYDEYRYGYIDALVSIKKQIKEKSNNE